MKTTNGGGAFYPDYVGQSCNGHKNIANFNKMRIEQLVKDTNCDREKALQLAKKVKKTGRSSCLKGVMVAYCDKNHRFFRPVYCEKEYCEHCGRNGSPAHRKRSAAIMDTVKQWDALSYMVITVPDVLRDWFLDKTVLNEFRTYVRRKLKRDGFLNGVLRWHWAGDCDVCKGKKDKVDTCQACEGTGCGDVYKPHLNILLPAGNTIRTTKGGKIKNAVQCYDPNRETLKKSYLDQFKTDLAKWFRDKFKVMVEANIYHNFVGKRTKDKQKRIAHRVKYVMRATLRHPKLADEIKGFLKGYKNTAKFGKWIKQLMDHETNCVCCGGKLKWFVGDLLTWDRVKKIEVKTGLFFIDDPPIAVN